MEKKITILVPCYNEEQSIRLLYEELRNVMDSQQQYDWQLLMVDDGSTDSTLAIIKQLREKDRRVSYVSLSRNFGKENAMLAGIDAAKGDCMIIMDADLQHPPCVIPDMLKQWEQGFQDVYAKRISRGKESWLRKQFSLLYYALLKRISQVEILQNVGDFRLLDRKCIDALKQMRESQRYTKGLFCWIGFRKCEFDFEQKDRVAGESSWSFMKLLNLAIEGITSFSISPLRVSTVVGIVVSLTALVYMVYVFVKTLLIGDPVAGYPTLIIVILFLGGMQLFSLGIIGEYIGRIFQETKHRPNYLVNERSED